MHVILQFNLGLVYDVLCAGMYLILKWNNVVALHFYFIIYLQKNFTKAKFYTITSQKRVKKKGKQKTPDK